MRVVALVSWFDEPDHLLEDCVASLRGFCDAVICLDGPYATYFYDDAQSPPSNLAAIARGAQQAGIPVYIHLAHGPWMGECEKRTAMFRLGERHTTPDDWFFCIDADERVLEHGYTRDRLEAATNYDAGTVLLMESDSLGCLIIPQLFRAHRGITIGPAHYQYSLPDGRRLWCCHNETVERLDTHHDIIVEHRVKERSEAREARRWAYYLRRDSQQMEVPDFDPVPDPQPGALGCDTLAAGPQVAPGLALARQ